MARYRPDRMSSGPEPPSPPPKPPAERVREDGAPWGWRTWAFAALGIALFVAANFWLGYTIQKGWCQ